ncbi:MAG: DEAD/DEAH box helicase, partial [Bdellovibrionales bacterium]|nr:DEAD/DEAH box helicase [Bdellovibrionales bacterium]
MEDSVEDGAPAENFRELISNATVLGAIEALGFEKPTPVQARAVPAAMAGKDLILQAQTGSGKTLSYLIPLLNRLAEDSQAADLSKVYALVLAPTRELIQQVVEVLKSVDAPVDPVTIIGGVSFESQFKALNKDRRVVCGTPGRVLDLIRQKKLSLRHCRYFVLDEADEMLSMGFLEDVRAILSRLPNRRQGLFISATISGRVRMLANSFLTKPQDIVVDRPGKELPPIEHFYCNVGADIMAKPTALCDLIETERPRSAIIFCNTKSDTQ